MPQETLTLPADRDILSTRVKILVLIAVFLGWMFDGLEMAIMPQIASVALKQLGGPANVAFWQQVMGAAFLFGAALGGLVFGWLGDKIGRVKAMSASIFAYSLLTAALYFVQTPLQMATLRFVASIGMGGEWALGVALVMEVWDAKYRPLLAGLIGAASNVGFVIIGGVGILWPATESSWRFIVLSGAAPALLTFFIQLYIPESPKWKREQIIKPSRPLAELFSRKHLPVALLSICFCSVALLGTWGAVQNIPSWVSFMPNSPLRGKGYVQLVSGIGAVTGCIIAPLVAAALNRRIAYFLLCLFSLISCEVLFFGFTDYGLGLLAMVFLAGGVSAAFYGWIPLYLPELFPTRVRTTAQGISYNFGRILAGVGTIFSGQIGLAGGSQAAYAKIGQILCGVYLIGMILIWFAPETKGKPMPD